MPSIQTSLFDKSAEIHMIKSHGHVHRIWLYSYNKLSRHYNKKYMISLTGTIPVSIKMYQYWNKCAKWQHYRSLTDYKKLINEML